MLEFFKALAPIFILPLIAFIIGRYIKFNLKYLSSLVIYICSPSLAFTMLSQQEANWSKVANIFAAALLIILASGMLILLWSAASRKKLPRSFYLTTMFMNSGYIGYPLALSLFGQTGLTIAILFNTINASLVFSLGFQIAAGQKDPWTVFKIPFVYAALAGLAFAYFNIDIPPALNLPLSLIGKATIPIALFILGYRLANIHIKAWQLALIAALTRITLGFLLALSAIFIFSLQGLSAKLVILLATLPSALTAIVITEQYKRETDLTASTIAISTIVWLISLPIILLIIRP